MTTTVDPTGPGPDPDPDLGEEVDRRLRELYELHLPQDRESVAGYYDSERGLYTPDAAIRESELFGISIVTPDGGSHHAGDHAVSFLLQSISKVFVYGLALEDHGREAVLRHVGVEPSGDPYNAIHFDERHHRPHNPMVNAGALVTTDLIRGASPDEKLERILGSLRTYAGNDDLDVDWETFEREMSIADRNRATAYLMRAQGMISADVEATLALYLQHCSVRVTCDDLAMMAATLANGGVNPVTGRRALPRGRVRDVLSVMYTCGMYDYAGQWAYEVGVPAKSGVSGGILAVIPDKMGIAVFSPGLDDHGNSLRGVRVCEAISARLGLHVFATEDEDVVTSAIAGS